jgi:hypothetical protein
MKRLSVIIFTTMILSWFIPVQLKAETDVPQTSASIPPTTGSEKAKILLNRLYAINDMDKSTLSISEKRELRKEVKGIKNTLKSLDGGVYLSVGAIIIIVLLLILIL